MPPSSHEHFDDYIEQQTAIIADLGKRVQENVRADEAIKFMVKIRFDLQNQVKLNQEAAEALDYDCDLSDKFKAKNLIVSYRDPHDAVNCLNILCAKIDRVLADHQKRRLEEIKAAKNADTPVAENALTSDNAPSLE